jgi:DNA-binding MarR family transcriptional regulator
MITTLMKSSSEENQLTFRFLTNHAHVLACIAADPDVRLRDVALTVGITERTAAQIVTELEQAGYLTKTRDGRRNQYEVHTELPLRHPQHRHRTIGDLIRFIEPPARTQSRRRS